MAEWLTIDEAAGYLGVARRTLFHYIKNGRLRAYKSSGGGRTLLNRADVEAFGKPVPRMPANAPSESTGERPEQASVAAPPASKGSRDVRPTGTSSPSSANSSVTDRATDRVLWGAVEQEDDLPMDVDETWARTGRV